VLTIARCPAGRAGNKSGRIISSTSEDARAIGVEQKCYNKFVGKNRVVVENAIAGMKRYNILVNKFRNKTIEFADEMIELSAGLWNFRVSKRLNFSL